MILASELISGFDPISLLSSSQTTLLVIVSGLGYLLSVAAGIWIGGLLWKLWRGIVEKMGWDYERNEDGYIVADGMIFEDEGDLADHYWIENHPEIMEGFEESLEEKSDDSEA